ncbi:ATP-binding protein [Sediminicola luteus]|uniref:ATP-binding protein n=1 Tax=Sediminicola luteus TaxID=319238 RepID=A0ABV2TX09_9FLAO
MLKIGDSVSIKIQTGVYGQFRNLNNKVWYALGEFVDNAVQSFENNKHTLTQIHGANYSLEVRITINKDDDFITIKDNAAGIGLDNYYRAFEPAHIPIDNTGLHEHGMGMKTAAIWLSNVWTVKTKAIGEDEERFVEFDLQKVINEKKEVLNLIKTPKNKEEHYTELTLTKLSNNSPSNHQFDKIKRHLASIYRNFIRSGDLKLYINGELLTYVDPEILMAPYFKDLDGKDILWKKEIDFSFSKYSAKGFIGVLKTMSTNKLNGISLFRRGRVIVGSHDEKYRPKELCGQIGSPRYKRIFGELELNGFGVSFNKGSFVEVEDLEALMNALKIEISNKDFDLYNQAEKYVKPKAKEHNIDVAKKLVKAFKVANRNKSIDDKTSALDVPPPEDEAIQKKKLQNVETIDSYVDKFTLKGKDYEFKQEFITDQEISSLYFLEMEKNSDNKIKVVYKINLAHVFFSQFEQFKKDSDYQPIVTIIKTLVLSELIAPEEGTTNGSNIRLNFNKFLTNI